MATHFVPIVFSNRSLQVLLYFILVALLIGTPFRHLWSLFFPFIRSAVRYIPAWPTPSNHSPIPAVTCVTEEPKKHADTLWSRMNHFYYLITQWKVNCYCKMVCELCITGDRGAGCTTHTWVQVIGWLHWRLLASRLCWMHTTRVSTHNWLTEGQVTAADITLACW